MKFITAVFSFCALLFLQVHPVHAATTHTLKGVVITSNGTVVPEFAVTVRPVSEKPTLVPRKHFKNGEFTLEGLKHDRYRIDVSAPLFITSRIEVDFQAEAKTTEHSIIILHTYRNERRLTPGRGYTISVKALQQKVPGAATEAYLRAVEFHRQGRLDEALVEYGTALRNYPKYLEALGDLATIFLLYNRPESALTFLRRAQEIDDCDSIVNLNIAIALVEQRDFSGAMKLLRKVVQAAPGIGVAHYYIAKIHYWQKKPEQAEKAARHAISVEPNLLDAWLFLANLALERKDFDQAREAFLQIRTAMNNRIVSRFIDEQLSTLGG